MLPGQPSETKSFQFQVSSFKRSKLETRNSKLVVGGADRDRTGDPLLAKQVLSQLSYSPKMIWWAWVESNYRPHPYQGCALAS